MTIQSILQSLLQSFLQSVLQSQPYIAIHALYGTDSTVIIIHWKFGLLGLIRSNPQTIVAKEQTNTFSFDVINRLKPLINAVWILRSHANTH